MVDTQIPVEVDRVTDGGRARDDRSAASVRPDEEWSGLVRYRDRAGHGCEHDDGRPECACLRTDGGSETSSADTTDGRFERRDVAKLLATVGGLTAVGSLAAPLAGLTRVFEREYTGPIYSDGVPLVDEDGDRIDENALEMGDVTTVFPETRPGIEDAPTLLVRFPEEEYAEPTRLEFTIAGYAAYSKVCTHAGCMVSSREERTVVCPCHFGKFDPLQGAAVVGGPPPRPLPQVPITLSSEGFLVATGDFEAPVGVQE